MKNYVDEQGVCDRILEECRSVMPSHGWKMEVGLAGKPANHKVGTRLFRYKAMDLTGHMVIYSSEGRVRLSGVVNWKPYWLPENDWILVCHEEVDLMCCDDDSSRMFHNDNCVANLAAHLSRAIGSFYAWQMSQGKVVPQRQTIGNRFVGW